MTRTRFNFFHERCLAILERFATDEHYVGLPNDWAIKLHRWIRVAYKKRWNAVKACCVILRAASVYRVPQRPQAQLIADLLTEISMN